MYILISGLLLFSNHTYNVHRYITFYLWMMIFDVRNRNGAMTTIINDVFLRDDLTSEALFT